MARVHKSTSKASVTAAALTGPPIIVPAEHPVGIVAIASGGGMVLAGLRAATRWLATRANGVTVAVTYSDQEIRQNVWDEISHDVRIEPRDITVRVVDSIVYLDGTVPTYSQKLTAAQDARRIRGVVDVVNNLRVTLTQFWTDQEIRDTIRRNLDRDVRITDPGKIHVVVNSGVVTLTGTVRTYDQKTAAADDAWMAPGVVGVINDIDVAPPRRRTDAEIEADVRHALDTVTSWHFYCFSPPRGLSYAHSPRTTPRFGPEEHKGR